MQNGLYTLGRQATVVWLVRGPFHVERNERIRKFSLAEGTFALARALLCRVTTDALIMVDSAKTAGDSGKGRDSIQFIQICLFDPNQIRYIDY